MALFPAYNSHNFDSEDKSISVDKCDKSKPTSSPQPSWLSNASFKTDSTNISVTQENPPETVSGVAVPNYSLPINEQKDVEIVFEKSSTTKKRRHRKRSRSKSHERRHKKKRKKSPKERKQFEKITSIFIKPEALASSPPELFIYDFKKDIENLHFGSVYQKQRATFTNKITFCLGATQRENVSLFDAAKTTKTTKQPTRYFSKKAKKTLVEPKQIFSLKLASVQTKFPEEFLPIENETEIDGEKCLFDPKIQMYRPIVVGQGLTTIGPEIVTENREIISENKRFNQRLIENPNDYNLWLEFLKFQDHFYDVKAHQDNVKLTKLALTERKLAILDKAIEQNANSFELKLLRLDMGLEAGWDRERMKAEWKRLEFNHINQPAVWIGRLKFAYSYFSQFTVSRQAALFDHCLEKLSIVMHNNLVTHPCLPNTEDYFVDFIVGKLNLWKSSGHLEKAFAFGQALIEFNCRQPEIVKGAVPLEQKRQLFEMFWDSNSPRIGDDNALGWSQAMQMKQHVQTASSSPDDGAEDLNKLEDEICNDLSKSEAEIWRKIEILRQNYHWHPSIDSMDPEDPERVVLFDDIVKGLYNIGNSNSRFKLILKILYQFGVEHPPLYSSNETIWYNDDALEKSFEIFDTLPKLENYNLKNVDKFVFSLLSQLETCVDNSDERIFLVYTQIFLKFSNLKANNNMPVKEKLKAFTKLAKQTLSKEENRCDSILYGAYAEGLCQFGNVNEAANVLHTVLSSIQKANIFSQPATNSLNHLSHLYLMNMLVKMILLQQKGTIETLPQIQQLVASFITHGCINATDSNQTLNILKTKKTFSELLSQAFMLDMPFSVCDNNSTFLISWLGCATVLLTNLYASFSYASSTSIESISAIFITSRNYLLKCRTNINNKRSVEYLILDKNIEQLFENEIFLTNFHTTHFAGAPKILYKIVIEALQHFPANGHFLKLFCDFHLSGQTIVGLRRYFLNLDSTYAIRWLAAVYAEFSRYMKIKEQNDYCDLHKIRHLLERAVEMCRNSVTLWRLYVKMESLWNTDVDKRDVMKILYQAIRQCPWSKQLYMDAIQLFPDEFQSFTDLMVEKEIRVRLPIEELTLLMNNRAMNNEKQMESNTVIDTGLFQPTTTD